MTEPDDLTPALRRLADRLDQESGTVAPSTVMARRGRAGRPRPSRASVLLAGGAAVSLIVTAVVLLGRESPHPVRTIDDPTLATSSTSTTTTTSTEAPGGWQGVDEGSLPSNGIAVVEDDRLVLLDMDGTELGEATGVVLESGPGPLVLAVRPGITIEAADADPAQSPPSCEGAGGAGGVRIALCEGAEQRRPSIVRVEPTGATTVVSERAPGAPEDSGHWRWALPSPNGDWVLAQWSGECETPTALLMTSSGDDIRAVTGETDIGGVVESTGIGWAPDGRAIVQLGSGPCGAGADEPGTYLVDPASNERTLLRADTRPGSAVYLWRLEPNGNDRERTSNRALRELGVEGCCGEPSHGGTGATTGIRWDGIDIPVFGGDIVGPAFVPFNDLVLSAETTDIDGLPVTIGEADLGPFVSFTCGSTLWSIGGAGLGERAPADTVRAAASALLPHLYCTVGDPPQATGHGPGASEP